MNKRTALITGASSGIGWELAHLFAKDGIDLVVVARRVDRLNALKQELESKHNVSVRVVQKDLSVQGAGQEIFDTLQAEGVSVDYLANNAGFGGHGKFTERDWGKDRAMINVNVMALAEFTRLFLPGMEKKGFGRVVNIASTAAFLPGPLQAVYYATKAFVVSFSQALNEELRGSGVTVTTYCPAATETEFAATADVADSKLFNKNIPTATKVAKDIYRTMMKGKILKIHNKGQAFALRFIIPFAPRRQVLKISRKLMES